MSDTLEERLNRHSDSFQGLLSLIPAKYYFDEETKTQWNRKKGPKSDKRDAKIAKLDPLNGSSAADEAKRRAEAAMEESDSEISVIYDDNGNELRLRPESEDESELEPEPKRQAQEPAVESKPESKQDTKKAPKSDSKQESKAKEAASQPKEGKKSIEQKKSKDSKDSKQPKKSSNTNAGSPSNKVENDEAKAAKAAGIAELRSKLQDKINQLREKRKAPGTAAPGAPKSREELLAVRKQKLNQKKLKRKRDDPETEHDNIDEADIGEDDEEEKNDEQIIFGGVSFKDGQKVGKGLELSVDKKIKKRTIQDQLRVLEQRKSKISELDEDKRKDVEAKAQWSRMILQSEGAKLKDNEKLLRKAVKQKKNKKLKSELEWNERKKKVADDIASREAKRNKNIANHTVIKHTKGKNQKKKLRQRAGFEGKKRSKN